MKWKNGDKHFIVLRDQPEGHETNWQGNISRRWMANVACYDNGGPEAMLVDEGRKFWRCVREIAEELPNGPSGHILMVKRAGERQDTTWTIMPKEVLEGAHKKDLDGLPMIDKKPFIDKDGDWDFPAKDGD